MFLLISNTQTHTKKKKKENRMHVSIPPIPFKCFSPPLLPLGALVNSLHEGLTQDYVMWPCNDLVSGFTTRGCGAVCAVCVAVWCCVAVCVVLCGVVCVVVLCVAVVLCVLWCCGTVYVLCVFCVQFTTFLLSLLALRVMFPLIIMHTCHFVCLCVFFSLIYMFLYFFNIFLLT